MLACYYSFTYFKGYCLIISFPTYCFISSTFILSFFASTFKSSRISLTINSCYLPEETINFIFSIFPSNYLIANSFLGNYFVFVADCWIPWWTVDELFFTPVNYKFFFTGSVWWTDNGFFFIKSYFFAGVGGFVCLIGYYFFTATFFGSSFFSVTSVFTLGGGNMVDGFTEILGATFFSVFDI